MTDELQKLVDQFSTGRPRDASLVELGEKGVYLMVKRYGALAGMPEIAPHDLRRAFGTHLQNVTGNIRIVQEILGHSNVNTTQAYTAVTFNNMEEAIKRLNSATGDGKKTGDSQTAEGKEAVTRHETYNEPPQSGRVQPERLSLAERDTIMKWGIQSVIKKAEKYYWYHIGVLIAGGLTPEQAREKVYQNLIERGDLEGAKALRAYQDVVHPVKAGNQSIPPTLLQP